MAFKLKWECEFCGHEIVVTKEEAELTICDCEIPAEEFSKDSLGLVEMAKEEKKLRYQLQYKENGYSWLGKQPKMWKGEIK